MAQTFDFSSYLISSPLIIRINYVLIHQTHQYHNLISTKSLPKVPHQLTINNSNVLFTRSHEPKRTAPAAMFM